MSGLDQEHDNEHFRLLAETSHDVIARLGPDLRFTYISPSAERLFKRSIAEAIGQSAVVFTHPDDIPLVVAATARLVAGETDSSTVTTRVIRGDGTLVWIETTSRPIGEYEPGNPGDRVLVMRDVSERKALEERLTELAMKDGLTGLTNRRGFDEALAREWLRTVNEGSHMSLLLLDIDGFKLFNDTYGHLVGDDCLRTIATALQTMARQPGDLVARYGGEEIAIILARGDSNAAKAAAIEACEMVEALTIPHKASPVSVGVVTVSIGVATAVARRGGGADSPSALLAAADRALYRAKDAGRNRSEIALVIAASATAVGATGTSAAG